MWNFNNKINRFLSAQGDYKDINRTGFENLNAVFVNRSRKIVQNLILINK